MRIGHVTNFLPGYHESWGGAEQAAHRLILAQAERGHSVTVFTSRPTRTLDEPMEIVPLDRLSDFSWRLYQLARRFPVFDRGRLYLDPVAGRSFARALRAHPVDVLHFHNINELSWSVARAAAKAGISTVYSVYDYWAFCPNEMLIDSDGRPCWRFHGPHCVSCFDQHVGRGYIPVAEPLKLTERATLRWRKCCFERRLGRIGAFVVLSEASGRLLEKYGIEPERIHVVRQPFDFGETADIGSGRDPDTILYVGWIQHKKGLHVILEALAKLLPEFPRARLDVIGQDCDAVYTARVNNLIERLGLRDSVIVHGKRPHEEVRDFMRRSQVLVLAEQWENMSPVVLVEAMALGAPVVAGRIGGIPEFVRDGGNGLLAQYDDPVDYAEKIAQIFRNPQEAQARADAAQRDAAAMFDRERIVDSILLTYESLLKERTADE